MKQLRSLFFIIFIIAWTLIIGVLGLVTFVIKREKYVALTWSYGITLALRIICGVTVKVKGVENIPNRAVIYASKHQSAWETIFFQHYLDNPASILKKELMFIPVYGWYLPSSGAIAIDRSSGPSALKKIISGVKTRISQGKSVLIFPEGTRVAPNESVELKAGIAAIHNGAPDVPIVPVALNSGYIWPKKSFVINPGTITVEFLPPITTHMKKDELLRNLRDRINSASNALKSGYNQS